MLLLLLEQPITGGACLACPALALLLLLLLVMVGIKAGPLPKTLAAVTGLDYIPLLPKKRKSYPSSTDSRRAKHNRHGPSAAAEPTRYYTEK